MTQGPINTRVARIHLGDDGIVRVVTLAGSEQTLKDAEEAVAAVASFSEGRRWPVLVDLRETKSLDRAARVYYAGPETAKCYAAAGLLVGSPLTRAVGNFFLGLNKPRFPTRLFHDEKEALEWLSKHRG